MHIIIITVGRYRPTIYPFNSLCYFTFFFFYYFFYIFFHFHSFNYNNVYIDHRTSRGDYSGFTIIIKMYIDTYLYIKSKNCHILY